MHGCGGHTGLIGRYNVMHATAGDSPGPPEQTEKYGNGGSTSTSTTDIEDDVPPGKGNGYGIAQLRSTRHDYLAARSVQHNFLLVLGNHAVPAGLPGQELLESNGL